MGYRDNFLRNEHLLTVALSKKGNLTQRYPRYSQRSFYSSLLLHNTIFPQQYYYISVSGLGLRMKIKVQAPALIPTIQHGSP